MSRRWPSIYTDVKAHQLPYARQSITTSVSSSVRQYRVENGRTYHSYKDGRKLLHVFPLVPIHANNALEYAYPNDEVGCAPLFPVSSTNIRSGRDRSSRYIAILLSIHFITNSIADLQHHLYNLTLDGKLFLAPIKKDAQSVLDVGTGTGLWAIEFGMCPSMLLIYSSSKF